MSQLATTLSAAPVAKAQMDEVLTWYARVRFRPGAPRTLLQTATILVAAHATLLWFRPKATLLSNLFILTLLLLATTVCLLGAHSEGKETRPLWLLLGAGFFLATIGQLGWTYSAFAAHLHIRTQAFNFDFFFFAYGIPILLAICSTDKDAGLKTFAWLDGAQALIAGVLAYLLLFSVLPSYAPPRPIPATSLMYLTDAANWILVAAVSLRFFSHPTPARRRFYRTLSPYLWVNAVVVLVLLYLELERGWRDGSQDAAWGLPELTLCASFAFEARVSTDNRQPRSAARSMESMELLLDNLSPVVFTLAIALMGVVIAREHPWLAFASISAAVAIYGIRAAILQVRYARSQQKLTTAMIATQQASLAKTQFLANMSHEIRTPMNGILGMTELALSTNLSQEQREFLLTVKSSADHLLIIINEILDYSKMEAGKTVLQSAPFHLPSVMSEALRSLAFLAHQKGLELTLQIAPDVPAELNGDKVRLVQVLINLIGNAIKFTEHGEVCVDVSLQTVTHGRAGLLFAVRDTGIGIALDQQEGVFQAFQQAHSSANRVYGGTGLGLAVSRNLVALMEGSIGLKSIPGEGTTVSFSAHFPLSPESHSASPPAAPMPSGDATDRSSLSELTGQWPRSLRILLAEDNLVNQKVAMTMLGKMGHRITLASNGREALELWRKSDFDLILMDVQMPEVNGLEATMQIRREEDALGRHLPIVAMTASAMSEDRERCLAAGMDDFISKPISSRVIEQMISARFGSASPDSATTVSPSQSSVV